MIGNPEELSRYLWKLDKDKQYEIKEHKQKRSLDQNSYAWHLITELANEMRMSKEDMYLKMLKSYGQSEKVSIASEINPKGYFKYYEKIGTGYVKDKEFTHYQIFKGSSEFNSKEMTIFIDGIIQECQQLGINTLTHDEIAKLKFMGVSV